jgi:O-Antigen ligase
VRSGWTADLATLTTLLVLTSIFGRSFAKLSFSGHTIFVTEIFLAATAALAVRRCGIAGSWHRIRTQIPLIPLLAFWGAGAIATLRGLLGYGLGHVSHDVGLAEYSIMLPIVAVVVDTRDRAIRLVQVLVFSGFAAGLSWLIADRVTTNASFGAINPQSAVGLYASLVIFVTSARILTHARTGLVGVIGSLLALWTIANLDARGVLLALVVGFAALILSLPRHRTVALSIALTGAVVAIAGPWALEGFPKAAVLVPPAAVQPAVASPSFVADDGLSAFAGGEQMEGDTAKGRLSRELRSGEQLQLPALAGLRPGRPYTVEFSIKPLDGRMRSWGTVGTTLAGGWGSEQWHALPAVRWQRFRVQLVAKNASELLAIDNYGGGSVLVDALSVVPGRLLGPSGGMQIKPAIANPSYIARDRASAFHGGRIVRSPHARPVPPAPPPKPGFRESLPPILVKVYDSFNPDAPSGASANASWRLAIWGYMIRRWSHEPVFGVGFGRPTNFLWHGILYDSRRGIPGDPVDVTGPHNSFIDMLFRQGPIAVLALLALVVVAVRRFLILRRQDHDTQLIAAEIGLIGIFAFASAIASLNVALEGPYMGVYFWTVLGLLLVVPRHALAKRQADDASRL